MDHLDGRDSVLKTLRSELLGPWESWDGEEKVVPTGSKIDISGSVILKEGDNLYGPFRQEATGDEIITKGAPINRYGLGVLYPLGIPAEPEPEDVSVGVNEAVSAESIQSDNKLVTKDADRSFKEMADRGYKDEEETDELDLSLANSLRPSAMGITFLAEVPEDANLQIDFRGGRYQKKTVVIEGVERTWWVRKDVHLLQTFEASQIYADSSSPLTGELTASRNLDGLDLNIGVVARDRGSRRYLLTVSVVNRGLTDNEMRNSRDEKSIFQSRFRAFINAGDGKHQVLPYPESDQTIAEMGEEEASLRLLYRDAQPFAVGHGCAADWSDPSEGRVNEVRADPLPVAEIPNITPQIFSDGHQREPLTVHMAALAGKITGDNGYTAMQQIFDGYENWIAVREADEIPNLDQSLQETATRHIADCRLALERMRAGLAYLQEDKNAARAFELANEAILTQQLRSVRPTRETYVKDGKYLVEGSTDPQEGKSSSVRGEWRPFQIAFILSAIKSVARGSDPERDLVELIWFPTGGGKTEAYLGLSAFALFYRRLSDPEDAGVEVLMRYTLRLLTQQQFQRAAALACAMEYIRRREVDLGDSEFSIGMWLGGGSTPNNRADARRSLNNLKRNKRMAEYNFVLLRCPWCSAQMGPLPGKQIQDSTKVSQSLRLAGLVTEGSTVVYNCPDRACAFTNGLPVYVIDEDIYEKRPSIVIATVDKFAQITWRPECRNLFGIDSDGERFCSPPGTIIQDELHLISGPLGSMVGLFESIIEDLATDKRGIKPIRPKIISSTATIRRYQDQIRALYNREQVALFPPRGISAADSYFAKYARKDDGQLIPGRWYVGVHAPGLSSLQTAQVRTISALLQGPALLDEELKDPWWTLMMFFNSLRELGTTLSLLQSHIPDYVRSIKDRLGLDWSMVRRIRIPLELTGRLRSDEVPSAFEKLARKVGDDPVDVCLSSSIIEVGIDIERLSHMVVVGQPKTTAQYIQVTGRVGRLWMERPALVTTIYSPSRARDRSHFEHFRSFHERLYAAVEPTSVTPFASPVLERALHAVLCGYVRQNGQQDQLPWPIPQNLVDEAFEILAGRVNEVDEQAFDSFVEIFEKRRSEWEGWERSTWTGSGAAEDPPLLRRAGEYVSSAEARVSWETPVSLRNVDAECRAEVSLRYAEESADV